jgi:hypothetical protein
MVSQSHLWANVINDISEDNHREASNNACYNQLRVNDFSLQV